MLEIFIPIEIKWYQKINDIRDEFLNIINTNFDNLQIHEFDSTFFSWVLLKLDYFSEDLIVLCNWEFWENYFVDFDYLENNFDFLGVKILWENQIWDKIWEIMQDFTQITSMLNSNNLLTNSKKELIKDKVTNSFFTLSWVVFLLYSLLKETKNNIKELEEIDWKVEYEWQAMLLNETQKTKQIELQAWIDELEWKVEIFILAVKWLIK